MTIHATWERLHAQLKVEAPQVLARLRAPLPSNQAKPELPADYRAWLLGLRGTMVEAQRITGGLRLSLDGASARTRVPVACHVTMEIEGERRLTHTGIFYNDVLERRHEGWRIVHRVEELAWAGGRPAPHRDDLA